MARKLLLLVLGLLIGAGLGAPFMFGAKAEQVHREFSNHLGMAGSSTIKSSEFSKGWFKSSARDVVEYCSAGAGCKELVISTVLHHGPIAITGIMDGVAPIRPLQAVAISTAKLGDMFADAQLKPALPDLKISTLVELDGNSLTMLDMPSSKHTTEGKSGSISLALGGISGDFRSIGGTEKMTGQLKFPSLKMEDASGFALTLSQLTLDVDGQGSDAGFIGNLNEKIAGLTIATSAQDPQPVELKDLSLSVTGSRSGDGLAQTQFSGGINTIMALGREHGPATFEGEVLRFNRPAMTRMQKELEKLESQKKPPQEMLPAMMAIYQKSIPEVLESRPEINLKSLNIRLPEGDVLSSFKLVGVPPQGELNIASWMTLLQVDFSLQIPAVTLWNILDAQLQEAAHKTAALTGQPPVLPSQDEIGAKVSELVKSNMFVPKLDANAYTLQLAFLDGRLLINGQENQTIASMAGALAGGQGQMAVPPSMEAVPPSVQESTPTP